MTEAEAKRVQGELEMVYRLWHQCGLSERDAKAMKMKPGRICDTCADDVASAMKRIVLGEGNAHG